MISEVTEMRRFTNSATTALACVLLLGGASGVLAQTAAPPAPRSAAPAPVAGEVMPPADYVIGADDLLTIVFWKDADLTADVVVRPDGKITLPLLNDIQAAGLTPEQLRGQIAKSAAQFIEAPNVMVRVRDIKSRVVTIVGEVGKQGPQPLGASMTVVQLIGLAGGVTEFADAKNILIVRNVNGKDQTFKFNFNDFKRGRPAALKANIQLKPGDQVVVP